MGAHKEALDPWMLWEPRPAEPPLPPRLAVYAHRVAEISRHGQPVGIVRVEPEAYWEQVGGALWWRRWSESRWAAHLQLLLPAVGLEVEATDTLVEPEDLEAELDDWDAGRFVLVGEHLALRWLDAEEPARVAAAEWDNESQPGPPL